ncbi:MAG: hypothetical protein QOI31_2379 [Solirubrobacterales bacterium]|jgi:CSLREA domain-containing protein|nr:hypothetical protein [Solirubrobacterales bacterium]
MTLKALRVASALSIVALVCAAQAGAETFEVTDRNDPAPGDCTKNHCTLREAINAANVRSGADRIKVEGGERYVLAEQAGPTEYLYWYDPLSIVASGRHLATIDAAGIDRAFYGGTKLSLESIRVTGGVGEGDPVFPLGFGGGIAALDEVELIDSKVTGNRAGEQGGGVLVEGFLTMKRSQVTGNESGDGGGGIVMVAGGQIQDSRITGNTAGNFGGGLLIGPPLGNTVTISRTTVSGNHAVLVSGTDAGGGGIAIPSGLAKITSSTISGNTSDRTGGGIRVTGANAELRMENSTVADNDAREHGGGINAANGPTIELEAVTIVRNDGDSDDDSVGSGGGVHHVATAGFSVANSLIALNAAFAGPDCGGDPFASGGHNLIGDTAGCSGFPVAGDLVDLVPKLGSLANNGGPTQTVRLKKGSPAIGGAGASAPAKDQRGAKRDAQPDIGAYER